MRVFSEIQRFDQWWFRLLMLVVLVVTILPLVMVYDEIKEDRTNMILVGGACGLSLVLILGILFVVRLETRIDQHGIGYAFFPFHRSLKQIPWSALEKAYVRKYNPIGEYGGWGYRVKLGKGGKALNVRGNVGIQLELKDGKKMLIGTQKEQDARSVLEYYSQKINQT
jgi:hypothetical protein